MTVSGSEALTRGESVGLTTKPCVWWRLLSLVSISTLCTSWVTSVLGALQAFISHHNCLHLLFNNVAQTHETKCFFSVSFPVEHFFASLLPFLLLHFSVASTIFYSCLSSYFLICSSFLLCLSFSLVVIIFSMFKAQLKQRHRLQSSYNKP